METYVYCIDEFCKDFKISRSSTYREIKAGKLKAKRNGGRTYITRKNAEEWVDNFENV